MANDFSEKVEFSGFKGIDEPAMADVQASVKKKLKRLAEVCKGIEKLTVQLKKVHALPRSEKYEVHTRLIVAKGKAYTSTITDYNLLFAIEATLENIESEACKERVL